MLLACTLPRAQGGSGCERHRRHRQRDVPDPPLAEAASPSCAIRSISCSSARCCRLRLPPCSPPRPAAAAAAPCCGFRPLCCCSCSCCLALGISCRETKAGTQALPRKLSYRKPSVGRNEVRKNTLQQHLCCSPIARPYLRCWKSCLINPAPVIGDKPTTHVPCPASWPPPHPPAPSRRPPAHATATRPAWPHV